jgi:hypothetical protein
MMKMMMSPPACQLPRTGADHAMNTSRTTQLLVRRMKSTTRGGALTRGPALFSQPRDQRPQCVRAPASVGRARLRRRNDVPPRLLFSVRFPPPFRCSVSAEISKRRDTAIRHGHVSGGNAPWSFAALCAITRDLQHLAQYLKITVRVAYIALLRGSSSTEGAALGRPTPAGGQTFAAHPPVQVLRGSRNRNDRARWVGSALTVRSGPTLFPSELAQRVFGDVGVINRRHRAMRSSPTRDRATSQKRRPPNGVTAPSQRTP